MHGYRCGNCRKPLIPGATFCVQCDSFFAEPVPDGEVLEGISPFVPSINTPFAQSRKIVRNFAIATALSAIFMMAIAFKADPMAFRLMSPGPAANPSIMEALNADIQADLDKTLASRQHAVDIMLTISTNCNIHHSLYSRKPGESILMLARSPMTPRQARNRALFAAYMFRNVRADFIVDKSEQVVRISLIGVEGKRDASAIGVPVHVPQSMDPAQAPFYIL